MAKRKTSRKNWFKLHQQFTAVVALLLTIAGLTFFYSNTDFLKGDLVTGDISAEYAAELAEGAANDAEAYMLDAETAYEASVEAQDYSDLENAQEDANNAADNSLSAAENAEYYSELSDNDVANKLDEQDEAETWYNSWTTVYNIAEDYRDQQRTEYGSSSDEYADAQTNLEDTRAELDYYTDLYEERQATYAETVSYSEDAWSSAELAGEYANTASTYAESASNEMTYSCSDIDLDPSSYTMDFYTETADDIELIIDLTYEADSTESAFLPNLLKAFTLTELEVEVSIDGIIEATPVTNEWEGILVLETTGDGIFTDEYGNNGTTLEIEVNNISSRQIVTYSGGQGGDVITASILDSEDSCTDTLEIEQPESVWVCSELNIDPETYVYPVEESEDFDFDVNVNIEELTHDDWVETISFNTSNLQADVTTDSSSDESDLWSGTLQVETDGSGTLTDEDGNTGTSLQVLVNNNDTHSFNYSGGADGDNISAYIIDEETACTDLLPITQETPGDTDGDGLLDDEEENLGTDPENSDTDSDGLTDGEEVELTTDPLNEDSDGDDLTDGDEILIYYTDPLNDDSDYDGLTDGDEINTYGTDPLNEDSDDDGLTDDDEINTYGTDPNQLDTDADDISDAEEIHSYGTDPLEPDTDSGGVDDGQEIKDGTDPLDADDDIDTDTIISSEKYVCNDPFEDTHGHWAEELICRLYRAEIIVGREETQFEPDEDITRAEWIKVIVLNAGFELDDAEGITDGFEDVGTGDWYHPYIAIAEKYDAIRTEEGLNFYPNEAITRGDAVLYAIRLAGKTNYGWDENDIPFSDISEDDYYTYAILIANATIVDVPNDEETPIIEGYDDGTFKPENNISRAEAVAVASRVYLGWYLTNNSN